MSILSYFQCNEIYENNKVPPPPPPPQVVGGRIATNRQDHRSYFDVSSRANELVYRLRRRKVAYLRFEEDLNLLQCIRFDTLCIDAHLRMHFVAGVISS